MGKEGQQVPEMTEEFCNEVSERYIELYEHITGKRIEKADDTNLTERIAQNILNYISK
jgi:phosphoribosylaminoimidazole-succinocarboxamide synthase